MQDEIQTANNEKYILAKAHIDETIELLESIQVGLDKVLYKNIEAILDDLQNIRFAVDLLEGDGE